MKQAKKSIASLLEDATQVLTESGFYNPAIVDKKFKIAYRDGYMSIPIAHIENIQIQEHWVDIDTDYMGLTVWTKINNFHITFYSRFNPSKTVDVAYSHKPKDKPLPTVRRPYTRLQKPDTTPVACNICGKTLKNKHGLTMHIIKTGHAQRPPTKPEAKKDDSQTYLPEL